MICFQVKEESWSFTLQREHWKPDCRGQAELGEPILQPAPFPWIASLTSWLCYLPSGNILDQLMWAVLWAAQTICQAGISPLARWSSSFTRARLAIPGGPLHNTARAGSSEEALTSWPLSRRTATYWLRLLQPSSSTGWGQPSLIGVAEKHHAFEPPER